MDFLTVLGHVNVDSYDNGKRFIDTTRLDAIEDLFRKSKSPWRLEASGPLFRIYGREGAARPVNPVVISSHADSNFEHHSHRLIEDTNELIGTFDNSITNAVLVQILLEDRLPAEVLVAFTGDEENESRGAADLVKHLEEQGHSPKVVIVLDITDHTFYGSPFTVENWFPNGNCGLSQDEVGFRNFLVDAFDSPVPTVHHNEAMPDESWRYEEEGVHVFSLCIPTAPGNINSKHDWMHDESGVRVKLNLIPDFGDAVVRISKYLNETLSGI